MEIVEIKCDGCGTMRKWRGYECLTFCDCLADKPEDESNLLDELEDMKQHIDDNEVQLFNERIQTLEKEKSKFSE